MLQAREDYRKVLELDPDNPSAREFLDGGGMGGDPDGGNQKAGELDPYAILGLHRNATAAEIKSSYRKLALKWHPDKHASVDDPEAKLEAELQFIRVSIAHEVLTDPIKKKQFDLGGGATDLPGGRHGSSPPEEPAASRPYSARRREAPAATHMHDERGRSMPPPSPQRGV